MPTKKVTARLTKLLIHGMGACYDQLRTLYGDKRSRNAIARAEKAGMFPKRRAIGPLLRAWAASELDHFYRELLTFEKDTAA